MATYLCLTHWTKEGLEKIKDSPARLDAARKAIEASGGKIKSFYMLMGQYDMAIVMEAPMTQPSPGSTSLSDRKAVSVQKPSEPLPRTNIARLSQASPDS